MRDAIVAHSMKHNFLSDHQNGFVPGRNCIMQLLLCLEDWTNMIENGETFDVIYTDLQRCFNPLLMNDFL